MTMVSKVAIVGHMICLAEARAVHAAQSEDLLVLLELSLLRQVLYLHWARKHGFQLGPERRSLHGFGSSIARWYKI
jgi:hypothetical protein